MESGDKRHLESKVFDDRWQSEEEEGGLDDPSLGNQLMMVLFTRKMFSCK